MMTGQISPKPSQIPPKTIIINKGIDSDSYEAATYSEVDVYLRSFARGLEGRPSVRLNAVVIFLDSYVWTSFITLTKNDGLAENFLQRAMKSEWEFNAGVRPEWWPAGDEADRMWDVHFSEDHLNGRAELARVRLARYDLSPIVPTLLPPREFLHH